MDSFNAPYTESGFTIMTTAGQWFKGFGFGNPVPNLFAGPDFGTTPDTLAVTMGGGLFTFGSFQIASNVGNTNYTIVGKNGVNTVFNQNGTDSTPNSFVLVNSSNPGILLTELDITFAPNAVAPTSYNIDNITVTASEAATVPEPSTFPVMAGLSLASLFWFRRRQQ